MPRGTKKPTTASARLEGKLKERQEEKVKAAEIDKVAVAEERKNEGNALFTAGDNLGALCKFSEAIELDPKNHVLYSNRSGANLKLLRTRDAVADAEMCTNLKSDWAKGWSRLGAALLADKQAISAVGAYRTGLKLEPANGPLLEGFKLAEPAAKAEADEAAAKEKDAKVQAEAEKTAATGGTKEVEPVIGIDLGTTFSCVGVWGADGVQILTDEDGMKTVPSYVAWTATGERVIGHAAKAMAPKHTKSTAYDVKRIIGQRMNDEAVQKEAKRFPFSVVEGEEKKPLIELETKAGHTQRFAPEEISAMILGRMKQIAEKSLGHPVSKAVITVPAYFNDAQRQATKNAGAIAGLEVLRIINEPTAAALAYGLDQKGDSDKSSNILIFDLGGGTFDATVLNLEGGVFQVLATGGDTRLGGEDFDNTLLDWLLTEFKAKHKVELKEPKDIAKLKAAAERAKRDMSTSQIAKVEISFGGEDYCLDVARAKFESLNSKIFNRTLDTVKTVLKDAKLQPNEIDEIVLVGGSTRVPKIQELLSEHFGGRSLCRSINPDEAVAFGAAVQGAILAGVRHSLCDSIVLVDVTPLSLGIEVQGKHMSTIIPRNTKIPCVKSSQYTTTEDYQEKLDISIFEGERPSTSDNHLLGQFLISGIERAKHGEPEILVTMALDASGIMKVSACDKKTGAEAQCTIANACKGLSQSEIDRMLAEAERFAKDDAELIKKVQLKNDIQSMAFDIQSRDKHLAEETLDWCDTVDLVSCPLQTLEARHKELEAAASK
jgi:L1 cell adhesion molecule like protein